jgi:hypothetical protein
MLRDPNDARNGAEDEPLIGLRLGKLGRVDEPDDIVLSSASRWREHVVPKPNDNKHRQAHLLPQAHPPQPVPLFIRRTP